MQNQVILHFCKAFKRAPEDIQSASSFLHFGRFARIMIYEYSFEDYIYIYIIYLYIFILFIKKNCQTNATVMTVMTSYI